MDPFQQGFPSCVTNLYPNGSTNPALKGTAVTLVVMGWGGGFCCFSFIFALGTAF